LYVGAYWKAPIFFVGSAVSGYLTVHFHQQYRRYQRQLEEAQARGAPAGELVLLRAYRTVAVERRDLALAVWVGTYLLAAVDAYVEAHLAGFDTSERLSLAPWMSPVGGGLLVCVRW
jgi:hypothetical protein